MSGFLDLGYYGLTVSLVMLGAALGFAVLPKFTGVKWAKALVLPLILSGVGGVASVNVLGHSLAGVTSDGMHKAASVLGRFAPGIAAGVVIVIALGVAAVFLHDAWDVKVDRRGVLASIGTPLTVGFIPGVAGTIIAGALGIIPLVIGGAFAYLLSGGW